MKKSFFIIALAATISACSLLPEPYKTPVSQGNVIKQEDVEQLKIGMKESQVIYLLGTPMIVDTFNSKEWRYVFSVENANETTKISDYEQLILTFELGTLSHIKQP